VLNGAKQLKIDPLMVSPSNHWNDWNKLSWAAVCDMPDVPWQKVTARSWHRFFFRRLFWSPTRGGYSGTSQTVRRDYRKFWRLRLEQWGGNEVKRRL